MGKIGKHTRRIKDFLNEDVWKVELEELSKARARFVKYLRVLLITIRTFSAEKIGFQAVALSFFSTMSVVPFIAIAFAITGGLGLADKLETFLYTSFPNSQQVIDFIINSARNIISSSQGDGMGAISALLFVWIVIWMMLSVERVFNNVWKIGKSRKLIKRLSYVIAMLLIAPLVILVFFAGTIFYSNALEILGLNTEQLEAFKSILAWLIFGVVTALTFSVMYKFIPHAKVLYRNAIKAAIPAAIAFTVMNYLYLETQVMVTRLNAVYGVFAAVPLFMIWINVGWYIILIGAQLSYAFQRVQNFKIED